MSDTLILSIWGIGGYFLGAIPFGLVLCYLAGYGDIRKIGSGNIGATNVLRTGNKLLALLTVLLDASKAGVIAFAALKSATETPIMFLSFVTPFNVLAAMIAGSSAVIGHNFPIWLKFKGGKGVASAFGFILATQPVIALAALGIWLATAFTFKYSSLSAITAAVLVPIITFFYCPPVYSVFYTALVILVLIRHHGNIARLIKGEESKIKLKKQEK